MKLRDLAPLLLTLVAAIAIHARDLARGFFADDYLFLDAVRSRSILDVLTRPDPIGNFYRPLGRQVHFWWLAHATGESPFAFHLVSLVLFLAAIALLWVVVRAAAGTFAATVAAAFLAVHSAADVPILWASGSQDLLALTGALASLVAFQRGRWVIAAVLYLLAILAKETVVLTPLVAVLIARAPNQRLSDAARKAWIYLPAIAVWGALQVVVRTQRSISWAGTGTSLASGPATLVSLARTAFGLETSSREFGASFALPWYVATAIALAVTAAVLAPRETKPRPAKHAQAYVVKASLLAGLVWTLAGALPVVAVAAIWSSYYFLFALCGMGMVLGVLLSSIPRPLAVAAVAMLGLASQHARSLDEFASAPSPWTSQSHVNRRYLERGMEAVARLLTDLRGAHPRLPAGSTLFFAGIPSFVAWQVGDGPLVRWAYRDTSLRSYYMTDFTLERAHRGPMLMFVREADGRLRDVTDEPDRLLQNALGAMHSEQMVVADAFYALIVERGRATEREHYFGGLIAAARGDRAAMRSRFAAAGLGRGGPIEPRLASAAARAAAGDTAGAIRDLDGATRARPDDPRPHAQIADLTLPTEPLRQLGVVEAFAARALAPDDPLSWRRWSQAQVIGGRSTEALASIDRYFRMRPAAEQDDPGAILLRTTLRERLPGSRLSQEGLRKTDAAPVNP